MRYPFDNYRLGTRYGQRGKSWRCGWHSGLDLLSMAYGGDGIVYPLYPGTVVGVECDKAYGNVVYVKHMDGYLTLYAHLKHIYVKKNAMVTEKTAIGTEGATGNATGRHLHIEVHKGRYHYPASINPLTFIRTRLAAAQAAHEEDEDMPRYDKIADMPAYAQPTIKKMVDKGFLNGSTGKKDASGRPADLDLSADMLRIFVINDRAGFYGK